MPIMLPLICVITGNYLPFLFLCFLVFKVGMKIIYIRGDSHWGFPTHKLSDLTPVMSTYVLSTCLKAVSIGLAYLSSQYARNTRELMSPREQPSTDDKWKLVCKYALDSDEAGVLYARDRFHPWGEFRTGSQLPTVVTCWVSAPPLTVFPSVSLPPPQCFLGSPPDDRLAQASLTRETALTQWN